MVGRTIGKYRIIEQIGRGGMGTVYKAVDETLDRQVAIKVLNADLIEQDSVERFRREAMTLARLNHPRIGAIHELARDGHDLLMVMEFISGETFEKLIERAAPLPVPQAVTLCAQVLDALQYAHNAGVVHRDLKPANVIVTPTGDVKIMDFGIARVQGSEHLTSNGFMVGTPAYMAPEQVRGEEVDPRMDLYAIAVVLYRLLTRHLPFQGDTAIAMIHSQLANQPTPPRQFRSDLPEWIVAALARGLAKTPADRFQSATEFRSSLEGGLTGKMAVADIVGPGQVEPLRPTPTPPAIRRPPTQVTASPASSTGNTAAPSAVRSAAAMAVPSAVAAVPLTPAPQRMEPTVTLRAPHLATAGILVALLVAGIGVLGFMALRTPTTIVAPPASGEGAPPAGAATSPPATASAPAPETPSPVQPATAVPAPPASAPRAAAPPTTAQSARGTTPATGAAAAGAAAGRRGAAPSAETASATGPSAAPPSAADAPAEHFADVRTLVQEGTRGREVDAMLSLEPGSLVVRTRSDGTILRSMPYGSMTAATYARARRPRGQILPGAAPVPENFGGGGILGASRHWLTLQTAGAFLVLRLEDRNVIRVLASVESRTGLKVQRNQGD